jgi:hypothetical protein
MKNLIFFLILIPLVSACSLKPDTPKKIDVAPPVDKVPDASQKAELDGFEEDLKAISRFETALRMKTGNPVNPTNVSTGVVNDIMNAMDTNICHVNMASGYQSNAQWLEEKSMVSPADKNAKCTLFSAYILRKTPALDHFESSTGFSLFDKVLAKANGVRSYFSKWSSQITGATTTVTGDGFYMSDKNGRALVSITADGVIDSNQEQIVAGKIDLVFTYKYFKVHLSADKTKNPVVYKRGLDQITEAEFKDYLGRLGLVLENIRL